MSPISFKTSITNIICGGAGKPALPHTPTGVDAGPPGPRFSPLQDLFGDHPHVSVAWNGLRAGWGIADFEKKLGPDSMGLLIREQKEDTPDLLAHRWRRRSPLLFWRSVFPALFDEALEDYAAIRSDCPLPMMAATLRAAPRVVFEVQNRAIQNPLLAFRAWTHPEVPLIYYHYLPHHIIVKWPKVLMFASEPHIDSYFQIGEQWILGGIPSRFVVFRSESKNLNEYVAQAGGLAVFYETLLKKIPD